MPATTEKPLSATCQSCKAMMATCSDKMGACQEAFEDCDTIICRRRLGRHLAIMPQISRDIS